MLYIIYQTPKQRETAYHVQVDLYHLALKKIFKLIFSQKNYIFVSLFNSNIHLNDIGILYV